MNQLETRPSYLNILRISFCFLGLGLLTMGCQPVLLDHEARPPIDSQRGEAPPPKQFHNPGPPPVPEISWSEPPDCLMPEQANREIPCARLFYRAGKELREIVWNSSGITRESYSLNDVPDGLTSFSPDFSRLVVQTPMGHSAGGPLYLYDLESMELTNINELVGLPVYTSVSALRVAGWHQSSQQLLLVNEDDEVVIWLDLEDGSYKPLALGFNPGEIAPPRGVKLAPDGSGFIFVAHNRETGSRDEPLLDLYWYDLETDEVRLLMQIPFDHGQLAATAIAPDGEKLAYLLLRGGRRAGRSEELHLLDLTAPQSDEEKNHLLLAGHLGPTEPVWSPDGEQIALIRRDLKEPRRAAPNQPQPLGDIWTISANGESQQLTFTEALVYPPIWSPDGKYLAFVTANGQIGMVAVEEPGSVWRIDTIKMRPRLLQIAFTPLEEK